MPDKNEKIREILTSAKALIPDEKHWWRGGGGAWSVRPVNCHCPITAIRTAGEAADSQGSWRNSCMAEAIYLLVIDGDSISHWSDNPRRTLLEIHAAFDAAIAEVG